MLVAKEHFKALTANISIVVDVGDQLAEAHKLGLCVHELILAPEVCVAWPGDPDGFVTIPFSRLFRHARLLPFACSSCHRTHARLRHRTHPSATKSTKLAALVDR